MTILHIAGKIVGVRGFESSQFWASNTQRRKVSADDDSVFTALENGSNPN